MFHIDTLYFTLAFVGMGWCGFMLGVHAEHEEKSTLWRCIFLVLLTGLLHAVDFTFPKITIGFVGGIIALMVGASIFFAYREAGSLGYKNEDPRFRSRRL